MRSAEAKKNMWKYAEKYAKYAVISAGKNEKDLEKFQCTHSLGEGMRALEVTSFVAVHDNLWQ